MPTSPRRLLAAAALCAAALAARPAAGGAQVVYSGLLNRAIPATGVGLYQNVVTGTFHTGPGTFPSCPGAGCNFDFQIWGSSLSTISPPNGAGETSPTPPAMRGFVAATVAGLPLALPAGTLVGAASTFNPGGAGTGNLVGGAPVLFGFRFRNEEGGANTLHYGWARVTLAGGGPGTLVDYAYNATAGAGIAAGDTGALATVPEPSTYALVAAGVAALGAGARRRARAGA